MRSTIFLTALTLTFCFVTQDAASQSPSTGAPVPCEKNPAYHKLDFWVGQWDVFDLKSGEKDGTNRIEKILKECTLIENWTEASDGSEGKSLFYYQPSKNQWKQVWVTDAGPMKEKALDKSYSGDGVRFAGEIPHRDGTSHWDRTTLVPLPNHRVRQTIEISRDAGKTWEIVYDAEYRGRK
jgi:hypothetical protein